MFRPASSAAPLWRQPGYLTWLLTDTAVGLATQVQAFVLPLVVILLTSDPALAGAVAALGVGARVVTTLVGGVLADRHDLRRLMVLSGGLGAGLAVLMAVAYATGLGVTALAVLNMLAGIRAGLLGVASDAALKQVVSSEQLPVASSANQARDAAVQLGAGPAGGALLVLGPVIALLTTAAVFVTSALSALALKGDFQADRDPSTAGSAWREAADGVRWLWGQQVLRRILCVAMLLNLGLTSGVTTLIYGLSVQGLDPARIGLVTSAIGSAMLVGAVAATRIVQHVPSGVVATVGMAMAGLSMAALPFVPGFWPTLAVLFVGTLGAPACNAAMMSYFMHLVPRRLLGRALSGASLLTTGAVPLSPVIAGLGLAWVGLTPTLMTAGTICLLAVLALLADRGLRTLPRPADWPEPQA
ncbi:MFS transporter [Ornithinimicrobium pratense]|uniref:MFS transporter n=1 Tax=Ornithinimicrobium pratense TaxID=2593973 RepID=A0A5J6V2E6_9MICO|nr:MFS transporter [Ornithinimicrobium pratense]QFG67885.1 MFS transporter [Ornithinimicrobium pratense]